MSLHRAELLKTLSTASHTLRCLTLDFVQFHPYDLQANIVLPEVHLLHLRVLVAELLCDGDSRCTVLLAIYRGAPALETLRMSLCQNLLDELVAGRVQLPSMRHLQYDGMDMGKKKKPAGAGFLRLCPASRRSRGSEGQARCLAWPNLMTLVFHSLEEELTLLRFVEHRVRVGRPLRRIVLDDANVARLGVGEREKYERHGLEIDAGSPRPSQESSAFDAQRVEACGTVITSYRRSELTKAEATLRLLAVIKLEDAADEQDRTSRTAAYATFLAQLDEAERANNQAGSRGQTESQPAPPQESQTQPTESSERERDSANDGDEE
ncbi:uncharacterized protein PHACADRAFT_206179 [Phanerochaete carnosa HHB-10118-sp]|uniref:Uncharacterized protein n=1 Tax=Phanerochaete carnosa (strain HHB-10118-sp) TaxID=650164 RepID=K5VAS5_PHACS|nr:uncharacterized protein PHACADRAFT_206179 [Phanerochaete carnosa HHB-10118-sp]EKM59966.1 hypothetical protein PHACADRAFT_206179 [Phanerochaete carnosa HHB-10118-sp]